jgi:predicted chitinase
LFIFVKTNKMKTIEKSILRLENKMKKQEIILKLENQIFIAKLYDREHSVKELKEVLTYLNQQK